MKTAEISQRQRQDFSKMEIVQKINEIKYLSSQKKIPKLTLRKEIIHLENRMGKIFEMNNKIIGRGRRESAKVKALKSQIVGLKKRLAANEEKDLHHKVDRLSHLLGECLAKQDLQKEVIKGRAKESPEIRKQELLERISRLKGVLLDLQLKNPEKAQILSGQIAHLESKLNPSVSLPQHSSTSSTSYTSAISLDEIDKKEGKHRKESKHRIMFGKEHLSEKELPLPPPPRMVVEKKKEDHTLKLDN